MKNRETWDGEFAHYRALKFDMLIWGVSLHIIARLNLTCWFEGWVCTLSLKFDMLLLRTLSTFVDFPPPNVQRVHQVNRPFFSSEDSDPDLGFQTFPIIFHFTRLPRLSRLLRETRFWGGWFVTSWRSRGVVWLPSKRPQGDFGNNAQTLSGPTGGQVAKRVSSLWTHCNRVRDWDSLQPDYHQHCNDFGM